MQQIRPDEDVLNEKQLKLLQQFQAQTASKIKEFSIDLRFHEKYLSQDQLKRLLIAREFNLKQAFDMWVNWVKWRLEYNADSISEESIRNELNTGKAFWHKNDKLGHPCLVVRACKHFPGQIPQEESIRFFIYLLEKGISLCEQRGVSKVCVIWDRTGVTRKNMDMSFISLAKKLSAILQDNYAERMHVFYLMYPNWLFKAINAIVAPFLSQKTKSKMKILKTKEELFPFFEKDCLLIEHGGSSNYQYVSPFGVISQAPAIDSPDNEDVNDEQMQKAISELEQGARNTEESKTSTP